MRVTKKIKEEQIRILEQTYLGAKPALKFRNPFELLIAVILSAQCTDKRVNVTTARLFAKAPTPAAIVALGLPQLEEEIRDCGLFRNKAKNIMATCVTLCEQYGGEVPEDYDALLKLPGVGRKTANVIASVVYDKPVIAVDTHVFRVSHRLGLSNGKTPLEVERDLERHIPEHLRARSHHWLILHGRYTCTARAPKCAACGLTDWCKQYAEEAAGTR